MKHLSERVHFRLDTNTHNQLKSLLKDDYDRLKLNGLGVFTKSDLIRHLIRRSLNNYSNNKIQRRI